MHHLGVGIDIYSPPYLIHIQVTLEMKKREVPFLSHIYTFRPRYTLAKGRDRMKMRKLAAHHLYARVLREILAGSHRRRDGSKRSLGTIPPPLYIVEPIRSSMYKQLSLSL